MATITLKSALEIMLRDIRPKWRELFTGPLKQTLEYAVGNILQQQGKVTPPLPLVLNAMTHCDIDDIRVVILGQDPYHTPGVATGLAFHCANSDAQPSLRNIHKALGDKRLDFIKAARQGVLFLNSALTTLEGKPEQHTHLWAPFVQSILNYFNEVVPHRVYFMLWGNHAQNLGKSAIKNVSFVSTPGVPLKPDEVIPDPVWPARHVLLCWTHPSPTADNRIEPERRFARCDHFKICSFIRWTQSNDDRFRDIVDLPHIEEFQEDMRRLQGKPDLRVTTPMILERQDAINYYVGWMRQKYPDEGEILELWTDGSASANGKKNAKAGWGYHIKRPDQSYPIVTDCGCVEGNQTNNRGELQAILEGLKRLHPMQRVVVFSDSQYAINTITGKWKRTANLDLLDEIDKYRSYILEFRWVKGHSIYQNNVLADQLANAGRLQHDFEYNPDAPDPSLSN